MKRLLPFLFISLIFWGCEKEAEESTFVRYEILNVNPAVDQLVKSGDKITIEYRVFTNSPKGLSSVIITKGIKSETLNSNQLKEFTGKYEYIVKDEDHKKGLRFKVEGVVEGGVNENLPEEVDFTTPKWAKEYRGIKLFNNYIGKNQDSLQAFNIIKNGYIKGRTIGENNLKCDSIRYSATMFNQTAFENPSSLSFVKGWKAHQCDGTLFLKVTNSLNYETSNPDQWLNLYKLSYLNASSSVVEVSVGDIFLVDGEGYLKKQIDQKVSEYSSQLLFLIKVDQIVDDNSTINNNDYIEFSYKAADFPY